MRFAMSIAAVAATIFFGLGTSGQAEAPTLRVLTYSSFTSEWGPGPAIKPAFEKECGCTLEFISVEDGAALLSRLKLEGEHATADIVLGLDTNLMAEATATGLFEPHGIDSPPPTCRSPGPTDTSCPSTGAGSPSSTTRRRIANPPDELEGADRRRGQPKIVIEDPRTSTPGLGLLLWIKAPMATGPPTLAELEPQIVTVTRAGPRPTASSSRARPTWCSPTPPRPPITSSRRRSKYKAAIFSEGHGLQVEVAGDDQRGNDPELARIPAFMLLTGFQSAIPRNWMYPAASTPPACGVRSARLRPDEVA